MDFKKYPRPLEKTLKDLGINNCGIYKAEIKSGDGLCLVNFSTDFQKYECMLDEKSLELKGLNTEPSMREFFEKYKYY